MDDNSGDTSYDLCEKDAAPFSRFLDNVFCVFVLICAFVLTIAIDWAKVYNSPRHKESTNDGQFRMP